MSKISQKERYRQSLIKYAIKYGVTRAAARYATNRQYVYRWMKRYDGSLESLRDKSRRPHHHPNEHSPAELLLIRNMLQHNKNTGLVVLWVKLRERGYARSISALYRVMKRIGAVRIPLTNVSELYALLCLTLNTFPSLTSRCSTPDSAFRWTLSSCRRYAMLERRRGNSSINILR